MPSRCTTTAVAADASGAPISACASAPAPDIIQLHGARLHGHRTGGNVDRATVGNATDAAGASFASPRALTSCSTRSAARAVPGTTAIAGGTDVWPAVTSIATTTAYAATAAIATVETDAMSAAATGAAISTEDGIILQRRVLDRDLAAGHIEPATGGIAAVTTDSPGGQLSLHLSRPRCQYARRDRSGRPYHFAPVRRRWRHWCHSGLGYRVRRWRPRHLKNRRHPLCRLRRRGQCCWKYSS